MLVYVFTNRVLLSLSGCGLLRHLQKHGCMSPETCVESWINLPWTKGMPWTWHEACSSKVQSGGTAEISVNRLEHVTLLCSCYYPHSIFIVHVPSQPRNSALVIFHTQNHDSACSSIPSQPRYSRGEAWYSCICLAWYFCVCDFAWPWDFLLNIK